MKKAQSKQKRRIAFGVIGDTTKIALRPARYREVNEDGTLTPISAEEAAKIAQIPKSGRIILVEPLRSVMD